MQTTNDLDLSLGKALHIQIMECFERLHKGERLDREPKDIWKIGRIYQDGKVNELFIAYRHGVALGIQLGRDA